VLPTPLPAGRRPRTVVGVGLLALIAALAASAEQPAVPTGAFDSAQALKASQASLGRPLGDYRFTTSSGETLSLSSLKGKPLVLSLVYTSCYHVCPMATQYLAKVVGKARAALGDDSFRVATLGFDTDHDTPESMRQFAKNQGIAGADWLLLSADRQTAEALMKDLGFTYVTSPRGFDHIIQASVIDAEGRIYRQVYGEVFETPLLVEPLKDLVLGTPKPGELLLDGLIDRIRFFCTTYDPSRDAYHFDLSIFIGIIIGVMILGSSLVFVVRELLRGRRLRSS
jgi:protein SCO1